MPATRHRPVGSARTNWPALMRAGIGGLRLAPAEFWALTPVELMVLLGRAGGAVPLDRSGLDALMAAYPDVPVAEGAVEEGESEDGPGKP